MKIHVYVQLLRKTEPRILLQLLNRLSFCFKSHVDVFLKILDEQWRERRKLLNPAFHFSILNQFIDVILKNSRIFTKRLEEKEINSDEFDIYPYVIDCTVDTIAGETSAFL